jgi:hypothetical protein
MNNIYFLDYYHPYAGLCNQLYLITNHIHQAFNKGVKLYINKFNIDIFKKERVPAGEVLDLEATNKNLEKLLGVYPLETEIPEFIESIPRLCIYPVSSIEILNCLEFNGSIILEVKKVKSMFPNGYNSIHFRLDIDAVLHYTFEKEVYNHFMDLANTSTELAERYYHTLDQTKIKQYTSFLMEQYFSFILEFGFDKPWYISTSITKWEIHNPMNIYLNKLLLFINSHCGEYHILNKVYPQRELNALVDLLVLRDSTKLIGFEGSSFSEGYCLKVNSIRKVTKNFLFVKEYP